MKILCVLVGVLILILVLVSAAESTALEDNDEGDDGDQNAKGDKGEEGDETVLETGGCHCKDPEELVVVFWPHFIFMLSCIQVGDVLASVNGG